MKLNLQKETEYASLFRALGSPMRLWIVRQLLRQEHCVGELVDSSGVCFASTSRHLAHLRKVGIIAARREGREVWYGINRATLRKVILILSEKR